MFNQAYRFFNRTIAISTACFVLSACGGEETIDNPTTDPTTDPVDNPTTVGSAAKGLTLFQEQCIDCHLPDEAKMVQGHSFSTLISTIETGMPLNDASLCGNSCASDIAAYLADVNPFFDENSSGSNSSSSGATFGEVKIPVGDIDAAPVGIRRLNRAEYNNTVRDLMFTQQKPADDFPIDDFGYGYNNIANVLSISLAHVEQYEKAADSLVAEAMQKRFSASGGQTFEAENLSGTDVTARADNARLGRSSSVLDLPFSSPSNASYIITVYAAEDQAGNDASNMQVWVNGVLQKEFAVSAPTTAFEAYQLQTDLNSGVNAIEVRFTNDYYQQGVYDRNLYVDKIQVASSSTNGSDDSIFVCDLGQGDTCARTMAETFGRRAWRRNLTTAEINQLVDNFRAGKAVNSSNEEGMSVLLKSILLSPRFLFRYEPDADLSSTNATPLTGYQLASRLSYFIWGSMPDDRLLELAENGSLLQESTLRQEVRRMLTDAKSSSLVNEFAAQWLHYEQVVESQPDSSLFPNFDADLATAMRTETQLFVTDWLQNNGKLAELLTANYTFLNAKLANHYGITGFDSNDFERYEWSGDQQRPGVIGHASVLTIASHPDRTAPVLRGAWVLDQLLCSEPAPPPPNVEGIDDIPNIETLTTREIFEKHRDASTVCYSCHVLMDPIGFGLENYDAIGRWRTTEGSNPVDSSGELPGGFKFNGPGDLATILAGSADLPLCATKNLLTYALGRKIEALDKHSEQEGKDDPLVYQIYANTAANGNRINDIIEEIVVSQAFRSRRGAESQVGGAQ